MAPNPLLALVLPLLYIFVSMFVLLNFTTLLEVISRGPGLIKQYQQLAVLKPFVVNFVEFATRVFGYVLKQGHGVLVTTHAHLGWTNE